MGIPYLLFYTWLICSSMHKAVSLAMNMISIGHTYVPTLPATMSRHFGAETKMYTVQVFCRFLIYYIYGSVRAIPTYRFYRLYDNGH